MSLDFPTDPAALASLRAEQAADSTAFAMTVADEFMLGQLAYGAEMMGFTDQRYFVEAHRAIVAPTSHNPDDTVTYKSFYGIAFEGQFSAYSKVHTGRLVGAETMKAVCLTFDRALIVIPELEEVGETRLLHVPVLAIATIEGTD